MNGFFSSIKNSTAAYAGSMVQRGTTTTGCAEDRTLRFSIQPAPGESGFSQWAAAMKMVAQLSGGIPAEFRKRLWLTLADRHLAARQIDWAKVERNCFSEWSHPADAELGVQIVKDLHRTGCSLFCGEDGVENQALLKKVLLAYARWNKSVGYCQGFNMLAALLLQVTDKSETDALKLMIYLIEGVLPDSYFADSLRGLSVDMAVFRELLRSRLPKLSRHLDCLQNAAKDGTTSYEPPLTNVFTMQWFLTLFCNCLPQPTVLRVWDLIMLEGNEMLLRTALAIWQTLADRIQSVKSADEFYCMMGVLTRELLEFDLIDGNSLIKAIVTIGPLNELKSLREHYLYNINPWGNSPASNRQMNLYPAAAVKATSNVVLDIGALKKQYVKLKQRQRQAHIIFTAAISRQPTSSAPVAMNHLLLGKSALVPARRLGPPRLGTIPPARQQPPSTLHWKDASSSACSSARRVKQRVKEDDGSSSSDTELCDEPSGEDDDSSDSEMQDEVVVPTEKSSTEDKDEKLQEESVNGQFLKDNPINLMIIPSDNIVDGLNVVDDGSSQIPSVENINCSSSTNIFDKTEETTNKSITNNDDEEDLMFCGNVEELQEVEEDCIDFEKFLQDRLNTLKIAADDKVENEVCSASKFSDSFKFSRRNSERALQIIQENSLILHRIMQCQSRLSPPIVTNVNETTQENEIHDVDDGAAAAIVTSPTNVWQEVEKEDKDNSPEYGSRYTDILEKSKDLDEKYNNLILNSSVLPFQAKLDKSDDLIKFDVSSTEPYYPPKEDSSSSLINFKTFSPPNELDLFGASSSAAANDGSGDNGAASVLSPIEIDKHLLTSPIKSPTGSKSPTLSPNKLFNPFPVSPLSSRQHKEVPIKLGLYKK